MDLHFTTFVWDGYVLSDDYPTVLTNLKCMCVYIKCTYTHCGLKAIQKDLDGGSRIIGKTKKEGELL